MQNKVVLPVRQFFPAAATGDETDIPAQATKRGKPAYLYRIGTSDDFCVVQSYTPRKDSHIVILLAALSCGYADGTSRFSIDELLATFRVAIDAQSRADASRIVRDALEWYSFANCKSMEKSNLRTTCELHFQVVSHWKNDHYNYEIEWNPYFLQYLALTYAKITIPVALGVKGGFFRTGLKDNAIVYWVESRLSDRTKKRCGDRFSLKTYLSRWGYPLPEEDPTHFARNIRDLDKRLNAHYAGVQWQIGDAPATVGDISRRNWDKVFVKLGERR